MSSKLLTKIIKQPKQKHGVDLQLQLQKKVIWSSLTRITQPNYYVRFFPPQPPGSIAMTNASDTWRFNTRFSIQYCTGMD